MITVAEACVLGVVQGLTEFLPVSSSGHLAVAWRFMTPLPADQKVAVDVALHLGTLAAVVIYFRGELWRMLRALAAPRTAGYSWTWLWLLVLATIPAALIGVPFGHAIEETFASLPLVALCFLLTGGLLYLASAVRGALRTEDELGPRDALVVGCFQALALMPGVSRVGATISGGLFCRTRGDVAAKFAFLLGLPAIGGAVLMEAKTLLTLGPAAQVPVGAGVLLAGITGLGAIALLLRAVRRGYLHYFAYYCWALGTVVLLGATVFGV